MLPNQSQWFAPLRLATDQTSMEMSIMARSIIKRLKIFLRTVKTARFWWGNHRGVSTSTHSQCVSMAKRSIIKSTTTQTSGTSSKKTLRGSRLFRIWLLMGSSIIIFSNMQRQSYSKCWYKPKTLSNRVLTWPWIAGSCEQSQTNYGDPSKFKR